MCFITGASGFAAYRSGIEFAGTTRLEDAALTSGTFGNKFPSRWEQVQPVNGPVIVWYGMTCDQGWRVGLLQG